MILTSQKFPEPLQYKTVAAGTSDIVFELTIPEGKIGFIEYVGNNWFNNTHLVWLVDNAEVERKIERMVAPVDAPLKFKEGEEIPVKRKIIWKAYNNDSKDHVFEVLVDGRIFENV